MNRFTLWLNCALWLANSATWAFWASAPKMAIVSLCAAALAAYLAATADPWDYRR